MKIGIAPRPSISESSWTGLGNRHTEQNFVGTKLSRCNCIGTRLHPDLMLLPFRCPVQTGNCNCLRNQLICTVFCAGEGNWLCCNPYTENTDGGDDDDLHMFDYADADFTGNWSLWRTSSMIWYHIKPHDTMKGPKILVKQCIKSLFSWKFNAVDAFCHVTLKVAYKMYPQHLIKNNFWSTPSITEKILSVHSYYCGHCIDITPKKI